MRRGRFLTPHVRGGIIHTTVKTVRNMADKIHMPRGSWAQLKKIVRAYGEVQERDNPTVEDVATLAGLQRPVVSGNNEFLRDIGILARDANKLTDVGSKLAQSLSLENDALTADTLQAVVRENPDTLGNWVSIVRARREVSTDFLKGTIAIATGVKDKGMGVMAANTILDLLQESKLIQIDNDVIRIASAGPPVSPNEPIKAVSPASPNTPMGQVQPTRGIPLPLGPTRLAYIQLPDNWESKELPKLLKLLQIALGDDSEGT